MAVAFYFDTSVNRAIALSLRIRDVNVLTVGEDDSLNLVPEAILNRAVQLHRPLITADSQFLLLAKILREQGREFSGVVFLGLDFTVGAIVKELEIYAKEGKAEDFLNRVIFVGL